MISKTPAQTGARRSFELRPNARGAFKQYLLESKHVSGDRILLPAYIGWSPKEGSGVFDPVAQLGLEPVFYPLDRNLRVDIDQLTSRIEHSGAKTLVLIHYFGYVDPGYATAVRVARLNGLRIVEDEAHAMLSDLIGGSCGRLGDACVFSLHKLLPMSSGGMLVRNGSDAGTGDAGRLFCHDLADIAARRRRNAAHLSALIADLRDDVAPLIAELSPGTVPQTYPVVLRNANRDQVYEDMNASGFGVVSLYHTLIEPLRSREFGEAQTLARTILNLPVHQDATEGDLVSLVERLKMALVRNRL